MASELALAEVGHRWISWRPRVLSWWIAALNLVGSIAFGVSAVAAYVVPDSGEPRNVELVNLGTFVGALGFLSARSCSSRTHRRIEPDPGRRPIT